MTEFLISQKQQDKERHLILSTLFTS